jgi:hypothetical protein
VPGFRVLGFRVPGFRVPGFRVPGFRCAGVRRQGRAGALAVATAWRGEAPTTVATSAGECPRPTERIKRPRRQARALLVAAPCRRELARLQTSEPRL